MAKKESWNEMSYTICESKHSIRAQVKNNRYNPLLCLPKITPIRGIKFMRAALTIEGCMGMNDKKIQVSIIATMSRIF